MDLKCWFRLFSYLIIQNPIFRIPNFLPCESKFIASKNKQWLGIR